MIPERILRPGPFRDFIRPKKALSSCPAPYLTGPALKCCRFRSIAHNLVHPIRRIPGDAGRNAPLTEPIRRILKRHEIYSTPERSRPLV